MSWTVGHMHSLERRGESLIAIDRLPTLKRSRRYRFRCGVLRISRAERKSTAAIHHQRRAFWRLRTVAFHAHAQTKRESCETVEISLKNKGLYSSLIII